MIPFYFHLGYFLIFIFSIIKVKADNSDDFIEAELSKTFNGKLEEDTWRFYKLQIPSNIKANTSDLVFRVKEPKNAELAIDDFSDPDIYVSTVRKN